MSSYDDDLDAIGNELIRAPHHHKFEDIPPVVYHYTDAAGLFGTLSSNSVWATETRFLNDRQELRHLIATAEEHVRNLAIKTTDDIKKKFYAKILDLQKLDSPNTYYVYSLSAERDDLSQWRGYARDGCGFTIGLSGEDIYKFSLESEIYAFAKVEYDYDRQKRTIIYALDEIYKRLCVEIDSSKENLEDLISRAAINYDWIVENRSTICKHKSFIDENEWRIISATSAARPGNNIKVRASGQRLVPYCELSLATNGKLPIKTIGIGPGFAANEQRHAVEQLCRQFGYDVEIYIADSPYRVV